MHLKLKKKADGNAVVSFIRDDGTTTTGRLGAGGFGAVHDLAHYTVETTLGLADGFLGLMARGWSIPDFEVKGTSAQLPDESIVVECIVGQLTNAVFGGQALDLDEFRWLVAQAVAGVRPGAAIPDIDAAKLARLQATLAALVNRWRELKSGDAIELAYTLPEKIR